ncbi:DUF3102 domain-containing protein [Desulfosporosinus meridiei]|uniref:Membrane-bound metallopeptidase n=1 Tax=Desulfosporosinus meridiei (strain ATCC BAA-275 / DSM 13257 / KCTC 12902 / NCIMB 13706 / S10) TaxID=768704 RepID=J7IYR0_DESMD|nr:DUF3102 domain-containing protein [Desulfosporosinus meridiei]AFQ44228.1 Protein of unknown function (DUF3102) [Desulfosporosinus meridiei DSM 13257]
MMSNLITTRTPFLIAAEINTIKQQVGIIFLQSTIEIGGRLKEARELLQYGEWSKWLEDSVSYSQKTAERMIRIFEEYGPKQLESSDAQSPATDTQAQNLPNLNFTQALILLGVPEEVRGEFIAELDIDNITTRELQKKVNDWKLAREERDQARQENIGLRKVVNEQANQITHLTEAYDNLMTKSEELSESNRALEQETGKRQAELERVKDRASYKTVEKMSKRLTDVYNKAVANKVAFLYGNLEKTYKELMWEMQELATKEPETHRIFKKNVTDFLIKSLKENVDTENKQA